MLVDINKIKARLITRNCGTIHVNLQNTPHYKFLCGDESDYIEYLSYYVQPTHSVVKFRSIIDNFDPSQAVPIRCDLINGEYLIFDGFHRACIFLHKGYIEVEIKIMNFNKQEIIENELRNTVDNTLSNTWCISGGDVPYGYHSFFLPDVNIKGQRNPQMRLNTICKHYDFNGKNVLDLGCSVGGMLFHIKGLNEGVGVDYDYNVIRAARNISEVLGVTNIKFISCDFNHGVYDEIKKSIKPDIIFLLSVGAWVGAWRQLYTFALSYRCPIILEINNKRVITRELKFFKNKGKNVRLIIDDSLDDITGNNRRKTFIVK